MTEPEQREHDLRHETTHCDPLNDPSNCTGVVHEDLETDDFHRVGSIDVSEHKLADGELYQAATDSCYVTKPIQRVSAEELTAEAFQSDFALRPLIITGLDLGNAMQWNLADLAKRCPDSTMPTMSHGGESWANLGNTRGMSMPDFAEYMDKDAAGVSDWRDRLYGFDFCIMRECPALAEDFRIPRYFSECMLQRWYRSNARVDDGRYYWPSLMAGAAGTRSGFHYDDEGLPFWMAVLNGTKLFRAAPPVDNRENYEGASQAVWPDPDQSTKRIGSLVDTLFDYDGSHYNFDIFHTDPRAAHDACHLTVYEGMVSAGEVIYIPNSTPHGAVNLDNTIAITANYFSLRDPVQVGYYRGKCAAQQESGNVDTLCEAFIREMEGGVESSFPAPGGPRDTMPPPDTDVDYFDYAGHTDKDGWCDHQVHAYRVHAQEHEEFIYSKDMQTLWNFCHN